MRRLVQVASFLPLVLVGCGDDNNPQHPDARMADASPDTSDAPAPLTCEYTEAMDGTNDALFGTSMGEDTALMFAGTAKQTICGKINNTHFDSGNQLVDVDSYLVHVPSVTSTRLTLTGSGAESIASVLIEIDGIQSGGFQTGQFI